MPVVERRGWAEKNPGNEVGQASMCSADSGYENDAHSKNWRNSFIAHARMMMIKLVQVLFNKQKYSII